MKIFVLLIWLCFVSNHVSAISWRIYQGREDCVLESIPEKQIAMLRNSFAKRKVEMPENLNVAVDVGFLVTNRYGGETARGTVDVTAKSPSGDVIYTKNNVKEDTFSIVSRGSTHGWEVCFTMAHSEGSTQPLTIELSYFTVNMRALIGTEHEKSKEGIQIETALQLDVDPEKLAKSEDLGKVLTGLRSCNMQLVSVRQMGHHLKMRTERHMKTVKSTHRRTLLWSVFVAAVLIGASLFQVFAVQRFFNSTNKISRV